MAKEKKERSTDNNCEVVIMKLYGTDNLICKITANSEQTGDILCSVLHQIADISEECRDMVTAVCLELVMVYIDKEGDSKT